MSTWKGMESDHTFLVQSCIPSMSEAQGLEHDRCLADIGSHIFVKHKSEL